MDKNGSKLWLVLSLKIVASIDWILIQQSFSITSASWPSSVPLRGSNQFWLLLPEKQKGRKSSPEASPISITNQHGSFMINFANYQLGLKLELLAFSNCFCFSAITLERERVRTRKKRKEFGLWASPPRPPLKNKIILSFFLDPKAQFGFLLPSETTLPPIWQKTKFRLLFSQTVSLITNMY